MLATLHLGYPLDVDQSLFVSMAREMSEGALLYRDFWDMKQPGVYWWYAVAGALFGHDAPGVRWMDLCWAVGTTLLVWATVRRRGGAVALLAPAIGIVAFYAMAGPWHLSQLEWILCAPIAGVVWCLGTTDRADAAEPGPIRPGAAGALIGVVALFKLVLVVVPLAMVGVCLALTLTRRQGAARWRMAAVGTALPLAIGFAAVIAPVLLWLHLQGTLSVALWTTFVLPGQLVAEYHHNPPMALVRSLRWFLLGTWAFWPPALWAVWIGLRQRRRLEALYAAWLIAGLAAIAIQVMSFWEYQFGLLFVPLGALAALGCGDVSARFRPTPLLWRVWLLGAVICIGPPIGKKVVQVAKALPFDQAHREAFENKLNPVWPVLRASAAVARPWMKDDERVLIWGDQRLVGLIGDHRPVLKINGDVFYTAAQMRDNAAWLEAHPPPLVYVGKRRARVDHNGADVLPNVVERLYVPFHSDEDGVWYRLRPPSAQPASAPA